MDLAEIDQLPMSKIQVMIFISSISLEGITKGGTHERQGESETFCL